VRLGAVLLGVGLLAVGAGAGWSVGAVTHSGSPNPGASSPKEVVVERERVREASNVDASRLTAQMRLMIREELANLQQQSARDADSEAQPQAERVDEAAEAERDASLTTALGIVDAAIAGGEWTAEQRQDVRAVWGSLDQTRQSQILSKLFVALNEGALRPTVMGPPI
jgi:hypothetical protein